MPDTGDLFLMPLDSITYEHLNIFATTDSPPREGVRLDFKKDFGQSVAEAICALANTDGGIVLVGVDQIKATGADEIAWPPCGIPGKQIRGNALANQCHECLRPDYVPPNKPILIPGTEDTFLLFIRIDPKAIKRPVWHKDKGILIRMESSNKSADLDTIRRLFNEVNELSASEQTYTRLIGEVGIANAGGSWLSVVAQTTNEKRFLTSAEKLSLMGQLLIGFQAYPFVRDHGFITPDGFKNKPPYVTNRSILRLLLPTRNKPEFIAYFDAVGVLSLQCLNSQDQINLGWLRTHLDSMLQFIFSTHVKGILGNIYNISITLSNWPSNGFSSQGYFDAIQQEYTSPGHSLTEHYIIEDSTILWSIILAFCDAILGEAGFINYEDKLKMLPRGLYPSI
jgi:hypothetical protein